jgi:hypothetical protein
MGRIQQLESLHHFIKGFARQLVEETVLEPSDDEAIVLRSFFAVGL